MPGTDPTVPADWFARGDLDGENNSLLHTRSRNNLHVE